ncbi:uncharacterized protein LOC143356936 [Halictus rubicundus]|uniref:uncharacterized protein LOC143356936 n=1 Tax=Halictus rubicundus TaxID=77578 RepID=UPI0040358BFB
MGGERVGEDRSGVDRRRGGPSRQSAVLRRRDEIATRQDVARPDIRATTVTRYKDCARDPLRIRNVSRFWDSLSRRPIGGCCSLAAGEACFPGCATVRCYPRFSIFRIPRSDSEYLSPCRPSAHRRTAGVLLGLLRGRRNPLGRTGDENERRHHHSNLASREEDGADVGIAERTGPGLNEKPSRSTSRRGIFVVACSRWMHRCVRAHRISVDKLLAVRAIEWQVEYSPPVAGRSPHASGSPADKEAYHLFDGLVCRKASRIRLLDPFPVGDR